MISEYDIRKFAENCPDKCWFSVNGKDIVDKESGEVVSTLKEITQFFREKAHCDFEPVYYCHATLEDVIRCKQCGTVIFSTEDDGYDPNLCCPHCGNYKTSFEYWTAEEIANDAEKQNTINALEKMQEEQIEADNRYFKRGRKYDWQIWKGKIKLWNHMVSFELVCDNLFKTKLKGLSLNVGLASKDDDGGYIFDKHYFIPLSISSLKVKLQIKQLRREGKL